MNLQETSAEREARGLEGRCRVGGVAEGWGGENVEVGEEMDSRECVYR